MDPISSGRICSMSPVRLNSRLRQNCGVDPVPQICTLCSTTAYVRLLFPGTAEADAEGSMIHQWVDGEDLGMQVLLLHVLWLADLWLWTCLPLVC